MDLHWISGRKAKQCEQEVKRTWNNGRAVPARTRTRVRTEEEARPQKVHLSSPFSPITTLYRAKEGRKSEGRKSHGPKTHRRAAYCCKTDYSCKFGSVSSVA